MVSLKQTDSVTPTRAAIFVRRALTTLIVVPLALWLMVQGGWFYFIPIVLIIGLATIEYASLMGALGWPLPLWLLLPPVLAQLAAAQWLRSELIAPILVVSLILATGYALWVYERRMDASALVSWLAGIAGFLLLGWVGSHFLLLRASGDQALAWTAIAMLGTWIADTAAYLFGTLIGKRKLAPRLSPNKTVEGYVAGIVFAPIFTVVLALVLNVAWPVALIVGLLVSVVSPAGDLAISLLKREAGVKDSGQMLPGHGGALDRIDSLMWSVTLAYYVVYYLT